MKLTDAQQKHVTQPRQNLEVKNKSVKHISEEPTAEKLLIDNGLTPLTE